MKNFILLLALTFATFGNVHGQTKKIVEGGIVNGKATYLPHPDYPQEAKDFCVSGTISVAVEINEKGNVISAKAILGDKLLRQAAVEAAKKAKFNNHGHFRVPVIKGIVIYNFVPEVKCLVVGIVNNKALSIPKPQIPNIGHPKHLQIKEEQIVTVQIIIDESGKVVRARTISGHPLLRAACENSARQANFSPSFINGATIKISALLIYKFKPDGTIDTEIESKDKDIVGKPINLVKPPPPFCNCRFGGNSSVLVEAKVDEQGVVTQAKAYAGHPILKNISEKAALESKFLSTNTKFKVMIIYEFESFNNGSEAKISNVFVKEVKFE